MKTYPAISAVSGYWDALCDGGRPPSIDEIHAHGLEAALDHVFTAYWSAHKGARIRFAGQFLLRLMGMDLTGMHMSALFADGSRMEISAIAQRAIASGRPARVDLESPAPLSSQVLTGRILLLPLRADDPHAPRLLGVLEAEGNIVVPPRRFVLRGGSKAPPRPEKELEYAHGFAEPAQAFGHEERRPPMGRPALRVVVRNDVSGD